MIGVLALAHAAETQLLAPGSTWRYLDTGVDPGPTWVDPAFDDSAWQSGAAPLGYGVLGVVTTVGYGPDPLNRYITTWFRQHFTASSLTDYEAFSLHVRRDDGVVVYLNGTEVFRDNLPAGVITSSTRATRSLYGLDQDVFLDVVLPDAMLVEGDNVVAVEIHQQSNVSNDIVMDLEVSAWDGPTAITRGPWIQRTTDSGAVVRWRTDGPSASRLWWGPSVGNLTDEADDPTIAFDHEVEVSGRPADALTVYAVGTPSGLVLAGDDTDHRFRTAPAPGTQTPIRIWVLGDSGTADLDAEAVRDAYAAYAPNPLDTDVWLMLGDNAYPSGTLTDYEVAVFDFYPDWLRQVALWPSMGNHDGYSAFSDTQTGPYFDLFTLPTAGEAGGEPSGTEAYWSFDHGNIHFVDLDSYHSDRTVGSPMLTWLEADLAGTAADWLIVMFHHPPYSRGSHNSDYELELVEMRENVVPILEDHGVDLVLTGHSHSYERSFLLDGHYGLAAEFDAATMALQDHDGDPAGDGAYTKWPSALSPHQGAVYVVAGASGQISGGALDHPAMFVSLNQLGSLILDVDGLELEAQYLDSTGAVTDTFAIHKGVTTIVQLTGDTLGMVAELLDFQGLAYEPDGTEPPSYSWDFGDGSPDAVGPTASHAWAAEGTFTVTLTVTDTTGYVATDALAVNIDNGPPVIDQLEATPGAIEGTPVTFTGHATDAGGDPVIYEWSIAGVTYEGDVVQHTFVDSGDFDVTLTAIDDAGREVSDVLQVTVANADPLVEGFSTTSAIEGSLATLIADVDDPGAADLLTVTWDVDGVELGGTVVYHTFTSSGPFPATITVRDDEGAEAALDVIVDVENAPPAVVAPSFDGDLVEGGTVTLRASASDPGVDDVITLKWDFGDGTGAIGAEVEHAFPDQGPWNVLVRAEDDDGAASPIVVLEVALDNVPASIETVLAPSVADEGVDQEFRVLAQDPGVDDVLTAHWQFGDGGARTGLDVTYAFADEGVVPVEVELTDDEGEGEAITFDVTVRNAPPVFESFPEPLLIEPGWRFEYHPVVRDPDPLVFSLAGPADAVVDPDGTVRWVAPDAIGSAFAFRLTADDGEGGVTTQSWALSIAEVSAEPDDRFDRDDVLRSACGCRTGRGLDAIGLALFLALAGFRRRKEGS